MNSGAPGLINNMASVTSDVTDPDTGNNSASQDTTVNREADLSITKTDSVDPVVAGTNLTYTVSYMNNGPSDADNGRHHGYVASRTPPTFLNTGGCSHAAGVVTCNIGTVLDGAGGSFMITVACFTICG